MQGFDGMSSARECNYCGNPAAWEARFSFVNNCKAVVAGERYLCEYHAGIMRRVCDRNKYHVTLRELIIAPVEPTAVQNTADR